MFEFGTRCKNEKKLRNTADQIYMKTIAIFDKK
jgi:hypothetical protein